MSSYVEPICEGSGYRSEIPSHSYLARINKVTNKRSIPSCILSFPEVLQEMFDLQLPVGGESRDDQT